MCVVIALLSFLASLVPDREIHLAPGTDRWELQV